MAEEFRRIERVEPLSESRLKPTVDKKGKDLDRFPFEVVLHASAEPEDRYILEGFSKFAQSVDAKVDASRRRHVGGLCFVPMHAPLDRAKEFMEFTFLRAMRQMPELVALDPFLRSSTQG